MRKFLVGAIAALSLGGGVAAVVPAAANAWPWDPHVHVNGEIINCAPTTWGYYSASDGEHGWTGWNYGDIFGFDLYHVPTGGTNVTISWGRPGCSGARTVHISRPLVGSNTNVGNLG